MINSVLQASKNIRTNTFLSGGTVSVSFAAIQYIKSTCAGSHGKSILLLGAGKIGSNTCKNLACYLPGTPVKLLNRTTEKARELANEFGFAYDDFENIHACINEADIIVVATNSNEPLIFKEYFSENTEKLIIDFSVPSNVEEEVKKLKMVTCINVDDLAKIKDETLQKRVGEIPHVREIITQHLNAFLQWHGMRTHIAVLKDVKDKLLTLRPHQVKISDGPSCTFSAEDKIQKVISGMAVKMRKHNQPGCHYIEAINDFISTAEPVK